MVGAIFIRCPQFWGQYLSDQPSRHLNCGKTSPVAWENNCHGQRRHRDNKQWSRKGIKMQLRDVLGEELFGQVDAKIQEHNNGIEDKLQHVRFVDLSEGGYISKEKYQSLETKANGLEKKYNEDTKALNDQIESDRKMFAAERFLDTQKIKSPLSRKTILHEFLDQKMEFKDGAFVGADEYMKGVKEKYPDEFEQEEPDGGKKTWVRGTHGTYRPETKSEEEAYLAKKYGNNKYAK